MKKAKSKEKGVALRHVVEYLMIKEYNKMCFRAMYKDYWYEK